MDPTITAAWITGGVGALGIAGTVVTAVVGSRNTRMATEATLAAARDDRLWDKRCDIYEATLTTLLDNRRQRYRMLQGFPPGEGEPAQAFWDSGSPGWSEARSRLYAYASDTVLNASDAAENEHERARLAYEDWNRIWQRRVPGHPIAASEAEMNDATQTVNVTSEAVFAAEQALIKVIRDELRSKPESAALPAPLPPQRRKRWHRR